MKKPGELRHVLLLTVFLIAVALFAGTLHGAAGEMPNNRQNDLTKAKEVLAFKDVSEAMALLATEKEVTIYHKGPKELLLPVVAINRAKGAGIKLREITITDAVGTVRARLTPEVDLNGVADIAPTADAVLATLVAHDTKDNRELLNRSYLNPNVNVSLADLSLQEGESVRLFTTATFQVGKKDFAATAETLVMVASLPSRTNWCGGDGHVHSAWSDAYFVTIDNRASYAAENGFKWIAITDHEDLMTSNGGWPPYISACNSAQSKYAIPVLPGAEMTAVSVQGDPNSTAQGDALGYWLGFAAPSIPKNKYYTPQNLLNAIYSHNPGYSYPVVAHPYGYPSWANWNVTGVRAMELLSNERQAKPETIDKWFELLRAGLGGKIAGGSFVVGVGNTDAHNFMAPGDRGFTWLYSDTYSSTNRGGIWAAIKAGRVSASGRKDLGVFTLNNANQGSVVRVSGSDTLTFKLVQQPVTGRKCTQITIRDKDNAVIKTISNPTASETTWTMPAPSSDTLYVVKFVFSKTDNIDYSHVWANPIFVDRI